MSESVLMDQMKAALPHIMFSNVESGTTSPGFPDLYYCNRGHVGTIELKYVTEKSAKKKDFIRPLQVSWCRENEAHGGKTLWLAELKYQTLSVYCIYHRFAQILRIAREPSIDKWHDEATDILSGDMNWQYLNKQWLK